MIRVFLDKITATKVQFKGLLEVSQKKKKTAKKLFQEEDFSRVMDENLLFRVFLFFWKTWVNTYYVLKHHKIFLASPPELPEFIEPSSQARKIELSNPLSSTAIEHLTQREIRMRRYLPMSDTICWMNCDDIWYTFYLNVFFRRSSFNINW